MFGLVVREGKVYIDHGWYLEEMRVGSIRGCWNEFSALQSLVLSRGSIMHKSLVFFHAKPSVKVGDTSGKSTRTIAKVLVSHSCWAI